LDRGGSHAIIEGSRRNQRLHGAQRLHRSAIEVAGLARGARARRDNIASKRTKLFARVNCTHDNKDAPKDTISNPYQQSDNLLKNCGGSDIDGPRN
jgi:hypothetical protein